MNPVGAAAAIHAVVPTLTDPPYFDDVFAELLGLLTERREWESVLQAYQALSDFATHGVLAAYEVVLAEAVANSLLKTSAERRTDLRDMYLNRAAAQREDVFSALLAATLLGEDGLDVLLDAADRELTGAPDYSEQQADFIRALMRFGLFDRAYGAAMEDTSLVDITTLADLADELSRAGRPRQSIQLAIRTPAEDPSSRAFRQMLLRRYPLAYAGIFESVLTDEPVDRWLLYGLVRSESLFDADAVSSAGAVGLAQLLGPTAEDVARRMRLDTPVLTDPLDNLRIGARYVSMLTEQFGSRLKALMAYNAGPGRVRSWESRVPDLDGILFHRAVPFQETYNHVRNVVVSTSYYSYLYADRAPADTVRFLFGDTLTPLVK
jgi:soluble lytic murein transglycosylase